jgi:hypothetical protein
VFKNRVLRRTFGSRRDEVIGSWLKLYNEELHNLHSSPSIIRMTKSRRMRWVRLISRMWEKRNAYRILVRKPEDRTLHEHCCENLRSYTGVISQKVELSINTAVRTSDPTRRYIPEGRTLHKHFCENLRSYIGQKFGLNKKSVFACLNM